MKTLAAILVSSLAFSAEAAYVSTGFLTIPGEVKLGPMSAVEVDRKGNTYVLHRGEPPLLAFDKNGKYKGGFGLKKTIGQKRVTYDFHRLMEGATLLKCSEFGTALIENM